MSLAFATDAVFVPDGAEPAADEVTVVAALEEALSSWIRLCNPPPPGCAWL